MTKELTPRILRNVVPNPQCLNLNVNIRISTDYIESFHLPLRKSSDEYLEKVGPIGAALVRKIDSILGCESVSIQQYSVQVIISDAFDPDEDGITEDVIEALKDCFGDKRDDVEFVEKDTRHLYSEGPHDPFDFYNFSPPPLGESGNRKIYDPLDKNETESEAEHKTDEVL